MNCSSVPDFRARWRGRGFIVRTSLDLDGLAAPFLPLWLRIGSHVEGCRTVISTSDFLQALLGTSTPLRPAPSANIHENLLYFSQNFVSIPRSPSVSISTEHFYPPPPGNIYLNPGNPHTSHHPKRPAYNLLSVAGPARRLCKSGPVVSMSMQSVSGNPNVYICEQFGPRTE
jgi:hypothetical protein